jgi:ATP-dependent protease ClpP protease subunit
MIESYDNSRVIGNEIIYFGEISESNILDFLERFKRLENELLKKALEHDGSKPTIKVIINSAGGDLFAAIAAMNILEKSKVKIITEAQGECCSAATFLLLAGSERRMGESAFVLIHQIASGEFWGKFEELKNEFKCCSKLMSHIKDIYRSRTTIPDRMFKKMMKKDIYVNSKECIKYGIVHEIA